MSLCADKSVIQDLLEKPFSMRTSTEKLKIINDGDPAHLYPTLNVYIETKETLTLGVSRFGNTICTHG
jgi:uncharacterized protein (DUF2249 family)